MNVGTACTGEQEIPWLHLPREPFEHGLLPLPTLVHLDGIASLRAKLINHSTNQRRKRVGTPDIAAALCLPEVHARLVLDTVASVLPDNGIHADPLARAAIDHIDPVGADIDDLMLFLYIQNYRKLQPRPHRNAAAVADIWPSNSAFDKFLASHSPLQMSSELASTIYLGGTLAKCCQDTLCWKHAVVTLEEPVGCPTAAVCCHLPIVRLSTNAAALSYRWLSTLDLGFLSQLSTEINWAYLLSYARDREESLLAIYTSFGAESYTSLLRPAVAFHTLLWC